MATLKINMVDAAIDAADADDAATTVATALADLLDERGEWDWSDGAATDPSDRLAIVESTGAWWVVYRGTEADEAWRCGNLDEAQAKMADLAQKAEG